MDFYGKKRWSFCVNALISDTSKTLLGTPAAGETYYVQGLVLTITTAFNATQTIGDGTTTLFSAPGLLAAGSWTAIDHGSEAVGVKLAGNAALTWSTTGAGPKATIFGYGYSEFSTGS